MKDSFVPTVAFGPEDYLRLRDTYRRWWSGELERPIVPVITGGHPSVRRPSENPRLCFANAWDFSISPEQFVDAHDWQLSRLRWHGDAFPFFAATAFGPGVLAAFLGCVPLGRPDTVWFQPPRENIPISELHFELDENNPCFRRVMNLYEAALEKWRGSVVPGMVDMGGVLDVLASFRGSENLLMDLYDAPDEVLRCVSEIQREWFRCFDKINALLAPEVMGYTQWFSMYSEQPGYILQSDFSYMISPEMFDTFVAPELASSAARLHNAVYHMDGVGQIPHLESLLAIDGIRGIQWVPGAGEPEQRNWDGLLERIAAAGKKLLLFRNNPDGTPADQAGLPGQTCLSDHWFDDIGKARVFAARYGVEIP